MMATYNGEVLVATMTCWVLGDQPSPIPSLAARQHVPAVEILLLEPRQPTTTTVPWNITVLCLR